MTLQGCRYGSSWCGVSLICASWLVLGKGNGCQLVPIVIEIPDGNLFVLSEHVDIHKHC